MLYTKTGVPWVIILTGYSWRKFPFHNHLFCRNGIKHEYILHIDSEVLLCAYKNAKLLFHTNVSQTEGLFKC